MELSGGSIQSNPVSASDLLNGAIVTGMGVRFLATPDDGPGPIAVVQLGLARVLNNSATKVVIFQTLGGWAQLMAMIDLEVEHEGHGHAWRAMKMAAIAQLGPELAKHRD